MISSILILTTQHNRFLLRAYEYLYIILLPFATIYEALLHKLLFGDKMPFLPLAFTSIYCAIGVTYCWIYYYYMYLQNCVQIIETAGNKPKCHKLKDTYIR